MKKYLVLPLFFFSILSKAKEDKPINYNEGFCVEAGQKLSEENAIIHISKTKMGDQFLFDQNQDHHFFDFKNGVDSLHAFDWGGSSDLVKLRTHFRNYQNVAVYLDTTHNADNRKEKPIVVECIALDLVK